MCGEVPESDFPKLFVAFLKRFKTKAPNVGSILSCHMLRFNLRFHVLAIVDRMAMKRRDGVRGR